MLSHAALVAVHDVLEHDGQLCIVMELIAGESLESVLQREEKLEFERAMAIAREAPWARSVTCLRSNCAVKLWTGARTSSRWR
jgi:hypothetical protein